MSIDNLITRALNIEEKAIRKVRTTEGARMYGQPIGTVITRDMIERAKRKRAREKAKKNRDGASSRNADSPQSPSVDGGNGKRSANDIQKEIERVQADIDKLKAKPDTGVESTRKRRERQIAKAEARIKELRASMSESNNSKTVHGSSVKKGDKVFHDGKWKTVDRSESWKGDQQVHFTDGTKTSFKRGENASVWMDDNEGTEYHKRKAEADAKRKKDEDDKAKAEQKKKDDYKRLSRTGAQLKPGDVLDNGSENGAVISRIEKEGDNKVRVFFEGDTMPKGLKLDNASIVTLKDTAKGDGKDGGSTSEPEFRELKASMIKEGDLIRHKGEWKKVEFADTGNGKTMLSLEGVAEDVIVPSDRAFEVQYPDGKKPAKGTSSSTRKPGTSRFAGAKKPSETQPTETKPSETKPSENKPSDDNSDGGESDVPEFDLTVPKGANESEKEAWYGLLDAYSSVEDIVGSDNTEKANGLRKVIAGQLNDLRAVIEERVKKREESKKPSATNMPTTGYADGGDVYIEPRPLTGDEVTKRADEYEERVAKEVSEWREYSKKLAKNPAYGEQVSIDEIAKLEAFDGNKIPSSASDLKWVPSPKNENFELAQWGGITLVRDKEYGKVTFRFGPQQVSPNYVMSDKIQDYSLETRKYELTPNAFNVLAKDRNIKKFLNEEPPRRVKRSDIPFWDYWNGIRGMDWMNEGESESDYESLVDRRLKAKEETARLGVNIGTGFNVEMHEVINSVLDTYKERYPGLLNTIDTFAIDNDPRAIAWLGSARPMNGVPRTNKPLVMGLNPNAYGKSPEENNEWWKSQSSGSEFTAYKVGGDRTTLAEKVGVTPTHLSAMYTFNHEMGHAIGHLIMGQTSMNGRFAMLGFDNPAKAKERMERYNARISPIMRKYGVLVKDGAEVKDHIDVSDYVSTGDKKLLGKVSIFNKTKLSAHLSGYGAYNWHEIMAETWASYSMDENPTQFSLEMGEAMEDLLLELMDEYGYGDAPEEKKISLREALMNKLHTLSNK